MLKARTILSFVLAWGLAMAVLAPQPGPQAGPSEHPAPEEVALEKDNLQPVHQVFTKRSAPSCSAGPPPARLTVNSTAYALRGTMANGQSVHDGVVAMNCVPFNSRYRILDGPLAGKIVTVKDRIKRGSDFDIWMRTSAGARRYGRVDVAIELVGSPH
ncbi:MAG TPA: hypothetical protein VK988_06400 [Acidimicrobiales bacterium]|nr:hypothetical protein [Acidimicrobiales bacterium]